MKPLFLHRFRRMLLTAAFMASAVLTLPFPGVCADAATDAASSPSDNAATASGSTPEKPLGERMPGGDRGTAPEALFSLTYQACMDAAEGTTTAVQDCMNTELERLERHVEVQRALLATTLPQERAAACREALGAWDTLRKSGSAAMFDPDGGTFSPLAASLWYLEQTARMAHWLDKLREVSDDG